MGLEPERIALADVAGEWLALAGAELSPLALWVAYCVALDRLGYGPAQVLAVMGQPALKALLFAADWRSAGLELSVGPPTEQPRRKQQALVLPPR